MWVALGRERSLTSVPWGLWLCLVTALCAQVALRAADPLLPAAAEDLEQPPSIDVARLAALGEQAALSKWLMLRLQAFDNQPGVSIPFRELDYARVVAWLELILQLDPNGQYPLLAATRIYGEVNDPPRQRLMLAFAQRHFAADPERRWPWLAHAVYVAKHRLKDLDLALAYARELAAYRDIEGMPEWAKQMHFFVLEDMGEVEAAMVLMGGLLDSGVITDPNELNFLHMRLEMLREKAEQATPPD